ncbi:MAG TPA: hypothetical protein VLB73_04010 [Patescibacteria group bacterium]|nr:hypothetical protein [Patescibacteria group bacterium]
MRSAVSPATLSAILRASVESRVGIIPVVSPLANEEPEKGQSGLLQLLGIRVV